MGLRIFTDGKPNGQTLLTARGKLSWKNGIANWLFQSLKKKSTKFGNGLSTIINPLGMKDVKNVRRKRRSMMTK